ncbi:uncharacterized protein [Parasteatoda tepidariorum]|uniref:uncharacterized protein n=1 Tax=Parasteatoda tepidariorum TaxID=114398 RepID=UPI00077FD255|nr:uncharacterized protein LOC107437644 isoform X2 [Parasteatoda tepidariorum]
MFQPYLKLVFSFLMHFFKRSVYEVNKLVSRNNCKDQNYLKFSENAWDIDHYVFQVKKTNFLHDFIKINGDMELNGRIEGLKNINIIRYNYCYDDKVLCMMAEFEASELRIHYDGIIRLASIGLGFLVRAIFKNVKIQIKFKIYPLQRITFYLDEVRIDDLKVIVSVSGLNIISWMINLIINYAIKVISFIILCVIEFHTKCYLNKTFSKLYFSQDYVLEKVYRKLKKYTSAEIEPCLNYLAEIEIAREILLKKIKFGPTSHFYNLITGLFEFNKAFNKAVIAQELNESFKDFPCNALHLETSELDLSFPQSSESESDTSSSISSYSGFDNCGQENTINSNEGNSKRDSYSTETVSTFSGFSSDYGHSYHNGW